MSHIGPKSNNKRVKQRLIAHHDPAMSTHHRQLPRPPTRSVNPDEALLARSVEESQPAGPSAPGAELLSCPRRQLLHASLSSSSGVTAHSSSTDALICITSLRVYGVTTIRNVSTPSVV